MELSKLLHVGLFNFIILNYDIISGGIAMCYVISIVLDKELHRDKADRFLDEHGLYIPNITSNVKGAEKK